MSGSERLLETKTLLTAHPVLPLAERLRAIGVPPLKSEWVKHAMLATSLKMRPNAWKWWVKRKSRFVEREEWELFDYDHFMRLSNKVRKGAQPIYGLPIPHDVQRRVDLVRQHMPDVKVVVYALASDDPWVKVFQGSEECWVAGWLGLGINQKLYFGK